MEERLPKQHIDTLSELENTEIIKLKAIYDTNADKLLGFLSLVISDEKIRLEILEKTFVRIYQNRENYDPAHFNLFFGMLKIAVVVSAECMNLPADEMEKKFLEQIKSNPTEYKNAQNNL